MIAYDLSEYVTPLLSRLVKCASSCAHIYVLPIRAQPAPDYWSVWPVSNHRVSCNWVVEKEILLTTSSPLNESFAVEGWNVRNGKEFHHITAQQHEGYLFISWHRYRKPILENFFWSLVWTLSSIMIEVFVRWLDMYSCCSWELFSFVKWENKINVSYESLNSLIFLYFWLSAVSISSYRVKKNMIIAGLFDYFVPDKLKFFVQIFLV